ncbi:MAG: HAMP domain-containing histidine kinase [Chloroflexi bacterium]|nr:HAMP domain-containing histidine kinase [Chloroflexota bacterium]
MTTRPEVVMTTTEVRGADGVGAATPHPTGFARSARTRILGWYVLLLAGSALVTNIAVYRLLSSQLDSEVEESLQQETEEIRALVDGLNPSTGQPFGEDIQAIFTTFLRRNITVEGEALFTLVDGSPFRTSPNPPYNLLQDQRLVERWARLEEAQRGVSAGVLLASSILAWLVAGRVLAPVRTLTATARRINDSDLGQRIPVRGTDEISELTSTFNQMLDRLEAAFSSQRDFIRDAGHELRTPITIVRGHLEVMGTDPEEQRETLDLVTDELDRMSRYVTDLLLLANAERSDFLHPETVDVLLLTQRLFANAQALGQRRWRLEASGRGMFTADPDRLTQAVMNLAQNAAQHTTEDDEIVLGSAMTDDHVRFWVCDTGPGIPPEDQVRIFERFTQGGDTRKRDGSGLGLAIVQAIARAHGGRVDLASEPHVATTFTIDLPRDAKEARRP